MLIYFWILNSGKTVIFYFLNYIFYGHFLIFEKHYKQFSYNAFERKLPTFARLVLGLDRFVQQITDAKRPYCT
ncbi:hypothetical protein TSAR_013401 [Trichomalopsis sarcophagae]|uniref:Uncharacterized protein n=1 Tax=Trichomalopsis sarcophagae TaxID=543379 RepID=A0A232EFY8_9HYME|nr:hypothetical protein TSAR_013401 [Trichomalopsis sarcophagae]